MRYPNSLITLFKSLVNLFYIGLVLKEFEELNAFSFVIACKVDGNASFSL
ncbi:hypothetical protein predicted by Glimmer/Critica [Helicobacter pylori B8]|uniref:Uncharacterized protein n=1 Tax=Helicobacter pylori (strain B8) TaxID=693745 RepID=D7FF12_HELP3|nr:hypothetical protein predicted by Glimmer/Critica [Helicobacter pylori B8]